MNFTKLMVCTLLVLSTSINAADNIGWGPGSAPGNSGGRDRDRPRDPRQPNQPTFPSQPTFPDQPSFPTTPVDPRDPWSDQRDDHQVDYRNIELQVNQYFLGQSRFDLLLDSYTRMQLQGKRIKEIYITASTEAGNGQARLLMNGQAIEQAKTVARQMMSYTFRVDPFANVVGQSLRNLELEMRGKFYVEKISFALLQDNGPIGPGPWNPPQPQVEVIRQQLSEVIQAEGGLHLFRVFNLAERQGQIIRRVSVLARSQRGSAQAQIQVNDSSTSSAQFINATSTRLSFDLSPNSRIGMELQSLRLIFRGNLVVEEVSLEIERASNNGGGSFPLPQMEHRIEQVINQRIYDTNGINLTALMRIDRRHEDRIVDSVELVLRNSDYGSRVKLCQQVSGQFQTLNCGAISTLNPGAQVVRLTSVNFAKLSELSLSVRMGMIDIERIIVNLR